MINLQGIKYLDASLVIYQILSAIAVLFIGFLAFKGLFVLIDERKKASHLQIDSKINYWKKRTELIEIKWKYKQVNSIAKNYYVDIDEKEIDKVTDKDLDSINLPKETPKEVEIPTLDELLAEKGSDFLKHSDESSNQPITNRENNMKGFCVINDSGEINVNDNRIVGQKENVWGPVRVINRGKHNFFRRFISNERK